MLFCLQTGSRTDVIIVLGKDSSFGGMKRLISRLLDRKDIECNSIRGKHMSNDSFENV